MRDFLHREITPPTPLSVSKSNKPFNPPKTGPIPLFSIAYDQYLFPSFASWKFFFNDFIELSVGGDP